MKSLDCLTKPCIDLLHKNKLLRPLMRAEMLRTELLNIFIESELQNEIIKAFSNKLGLSDENGLDSWLAEKEMSKVDFEELALKEVKLKRFCKENFDNKVEQHFLKRKSKLDIVVYSLIRVSNIYIARELCLRIANKEDEFGDLASIYSNGIEKNTRGIVGPCTLDKTHPKLANILKSAEPGKIIGPIKVEKSFLIVRLESYDSAKLDDYMRDQMRLELCNNFIESRVNENYLNILNSKNSKEMVG